MALGFAVLQSYSNMSSFDSFIKYHRSLGYVTNREDPMTFTIVDDSGDSHPVNDLFVSDAIQNKRSLLIKFYLIHGTQFLWPAEME